MTNTYRKDLNWLVSDFTSRVADIAHAAVVSADGVPLAMSEHIPSEFAEQLAAITSGLASLMDGAARIFEAGSPTQALVEMESGLMLIKTISDGSSLLVLASLECDTDLVSYEMSLLVEAAGEVLSPALRNGQFSYLQAGQAAAAGSGRLGPAPPPLLAPGGQQVDRVVVGVPAPERQRVVRLKDGTVVLRPATDA